VNDTFLFKRAFKANNEALKVDEEVWHFYSVLHELLLA